MKQHSKAFVIHQGMRSPCRLRKHVDTHVQVCNNLALAIQMASVAEAAALGRRLGLDQKVLADIFNSSSARCWSSDLIPPCACASAHAVTPLLLGPFAACATLVCPSCWAGMVSLSQIQISVPGVNAACEA